MQWAGEEVGVVIMARRRGNAPKPWGLGVGRCVWVHGPRVVQLRRVTRF